MEDGRNAVSVQPISRNAERCKKWRQSQGKEFKVKEAERKKHARNKRTPTQIERDSSTSKERVRRKREKRKADGQNTSKKRDSSTSKERVRRKREKRKADGQNTSKKRLKKTMAEYTDCPSNMSDVDPTKLCDSCKVPGIHKQAGTHCQDCSEDLCDSCEEIHRSLKMSRDHELKPFDEKKKTSIKQRNLISATMTYEDHRSEVMSLLCLDHNKPTCRQCKLTKHRKCKTNTLQEVAEEVKSNEDMAQFSEKVKELTRNLKELKESREQTKETLQSCSEELIMEIKQFKEEIVTWANNLERVMLDEVESTRGKLFNVIDEEVQTAGDCFQEITSLSKKQDESDICFQEITSLSKKETINVGTKGVTGCVFMPDGELVICDGDGTYTVKVMTRDFKLRHEIKLSSRAVDVAVVSQNEVIVTQPESNILQVLKVSDTLEKGKSFPVDKNCRGVDCKNDMIYVSCHSGEGNGGTIIKVLTMTGVTLGSLNVHQGDPSYLAVNSTGDRIMISTGTSYIALYTDITRKVLYTYKDSELSGPLGMIVDSDDNVMVCGWTSNNMHVVKKDGTKHRVILISGDGMEYPYCLAYRASDRTLVVGQLSKGKSLLAFTVNK